MWVQFPKEEIFVSLKHIEMIMGVKRAYLLFVKLCDLYTNSLQLRKTMLAGFNLHISFFHVTDSSS
jgi:hypothetical protein